MPPDSTQIRQVIIDLLRIAKVAMPADLQAQDARILAAQRLVASLDAEADAVWDDIAEGLDLFLQEDFAPATRPEAISAILRDWLVGHGYLPPVPAIEERH